MSFLNKIKGWGGKDGAAAEISEADHTPLAQALPMSEHTGGFDTPPGAALSDGVRHETPTVQHAADFDTSIISEAAPSEIADFAETRVRTR